VPKHPSPSGSGTRPYHRLLLDFEMSLRRVWFEPVGLVFGLGLIDFDPYRLGPPKHKRGAT